MAEKCALDQLPLISPRTKKRIKNQALTVKLLQLDRNSKCYFNCAVKTDVSSEINNTVWKVSRYGIFSGGQLGTKK